MAGGIPEIECMKAARDAQYLTGIAVLLSVYVDGLARRILYLDVFHADSLFRQACQQSKTASFRMRALFVLVLFALLAPLRRIADLEWILEIIEPHAEDF
jgi:hypothetical protein